MDLKDLGLFQVVPRLAHEKKKKTWRLMFLLIPVGIWQKPLASLTIFIVTNTKPTKYFWLLALQNNNL